ncbi:hypothetical protein [Chloroflexus sp.]|uniref:hypothetical protein n=1 Tax=Chloroflexus sp. TaxID=1904827 RepID=UPI002629D639|nr:hypothetical protein [uncultured Chloroflexus sp.]
MTMTKPVTDPQWTGWHKGLAALIGAIVFVIGLRSYTDPDLWGHLRYGLDAIEAGTLIRTDPYSYLNEGYPWINHEWLMEVLMGVAWLADGEAGLIIMRLLVYSLTLTLVFWRLVTAARMSFVPAIVVWISVVLTTIWFNFPVRPQIFTFLLFTCTLIIVDEAEQGRYRWLWLMPFIVAAWVNLHGGFLAGCGILGIWTVAHLALNPRQWRQIVPPVALSALATLANPYGWELLHFLLETATVDRPEIADWQPLPVRSELGMIYLAVSGLALYSLHRSTLSKQPILIGLFFLLLILPLTAIRHLPLMGIGFAIFVGKHVESAWKTFPIRSQDIAVPRRLQPVPSILATVVALVGLVSFNWRFSPAMEVPYNAMILLRESSFRGRLMCDFGWGQYLIWHLGPEVQVGMDGRRETVYSPEVYDQYVDFHFGRNDWEAILKRQSADAVIVGRNSPPANLLALKPEWQQVFADESSVLFINTTSTAARVIEQAARTFQPRLSVTAFP